MTDRGERRVEIPGFRDFFEIGRGGFAIVYRATQEIFGREVAVKVITVLDVDQSARGRFQRECTAIGRLAWHPHIVSVFDAGETPEGWPYLVMEYLPAGSLGDRLDRGSRVPWPEALEIAGKIAGALQAAHDEGSLHRDIKPDNILVNRLGEPTLADFGIATLQDGTRSRSGVVTATLAYAAPEVIAGRRATVASDVYSLGATIHALMTGTAPFTLATDESIFAVIRRIEAEPPDDLRVLGVPHDVANVIEQSMAKTPEARPASVTEFAEQLSAAHRSAGAIETTPSVLAVLADPLMVIDPAPSGHEPVAPAPVVVSRDPRANGASGPSRSTRARWLVAACAVLVGAGAVGFVAARSGDDGAPGGTAGADLGEPTGDGTVDPFPDPEPGRIVTIIGTGTSGDSGDGAALETLLNSPWAIVVGGDGTIKIADSGRHRIRIAQDGFVTTLVSPPDYGELASPRGLAEGPSASLLIADTVHSRIVSMGSDLALTVVAGEGALDDPDSSETGYSGDGGPATEALLNEPHGLALAPDGSLYFADTGNNVIRVISEQGTITTVAGTGEPGYSGDGGPPTDAQLEAPLSVAFVGDDILIADSQNHCIRRISSDGTITTFAGTGEPGYSGDGGPAVDAQLDTPSGLAVADDGSIYVADTANNRIRKIALDGTITTVAGTGEVGPGPENVPAIDAHLYQPRGLAIGPDGDLYIADTENHRIRRMG